MPQTALNLLAIGIFSITMLSLIAPIAQIPLGVPAGITLGILGLATADTLAWQSRGVTLLLDLFATKEERERVLRHEAGHFLTAFCLGIPVTGYTLTAWEAFRSGQAGRGGVQFEATRLVDLVPGQPEFQLAVERYSTVWMAGMAAEKMVYGNTLGGGDDHEQLYLAYRLCQIPESKFEQKEKWSQLQAQSILERHRQAYDALVDALRSRTSVDDCYQLLQARLQEELS
ncbi:MAG: ATP-dependent Zn protease [Cyanobacteria bacterium P01_H01_bin.15]